MKKDKNVCSTSGKKIIALMIALVMALGMLCACGSSSEEGAGEPTEKATVTAGEAAEKEAQKETTKIVKTGTEDAAIDAIHAAVYEDIEGYDGKWQNVNIDVDDAVTTIEFDWNDQHYVYQYDQEKGEVIR